VPARKRKTTYPVANTSKRPPPADAPVVKLILLFRTECVEDRLALLFRQTPEIKLVVIAQEDSPLRRFGPLLRLSHRLGERPRVG